MKAQGKTTALSPHDTKAQLPEDARQRSRKRISQIAPGMYDLLDAALEYRADDEDVSADFGVRRADAAHLFGRRTRKLVRQVQSDVRQLRDEVREMRGWLRRVA